MLQNILSTIVFLASLVLTYFGWHWTGGRLSGAIMGFLLIAAPGFYYVYVEWPKQQARKKELQEDVTE